MGDTIHIKVKLDQAAKFAGEARIVSAEIDEMGDAAARADRKSRKASSGLNYMQKSLKLLKPVLIVTALGLFTQALNAAGAGAFAFGAALAPLGGLLGALPAGLLMAAQGALALKLAFSGVGGALGGLNGQIDPKKFAALTGPGQQFVLTLNSMKAPIRDLQARIQNGLFPGLTKGLNAAKPALHALMGPLGKTGGVFGNIGDKLGHLVGSRSFSKDLADQARFNNVQLGRLGGAGIHVIDIFRQLMVVSRPLVSWLVKLASGWAASADKSLIAGRQNGKLAGIFRTIQHTAASVFSILGNVGKMLWNIGVIGRTSLGTSLLDSLVKGSKALRVWSESGPGVSKITKFFADAKPVVYAFAKLIGSLVVDILKLGTGGGANGGLATLFNTLRTQVLPVLLKVTEGLVKVFGLFSRTPGAAWLLMIGYILTKVGLLGAAFGAAGRLAGLAFASQFETAALTGMYAIDWAKGVGGTALAKIGAAGSVAGTAFQVAFVAGFAALVGYELGHVLGDWINNHKFHFSLSKLLKGEQPLTIETLEPVSPKSVGKGRKNFANPPTMHRFLQEHPNRHPLGGAGTKKLALGGLIASPGFVEVGDRGPELLSLPRSAMVTPLSPSLRAPTMTDVHTTGAGSRWSEQPIHVHAHTTLKLNDKPIAEGTNEVVARTRALV